MRNGLRGLMIACAGGLLLGAAEEIAYRNDFEKAEAGSVPEEMLILNGNFEVKKEGGNAYLELPGDPLDTFGFMVGPEDPSPSLVGGRIWSDVTGKRFPEFGVGLRGSGGVKLWLMPIIGELQLRQGNEVIARKGHDWKPGTWTTMRLRLRDAGGGKWVVEGKAWGEGEKEPETWEISAELAEPPSAGRASMWGIPFASKPVRFDDIVVGK